MNRSMWDHFSEDFGWTPCKGDVGIEVETEGDNLPLLGGNYGWTSVRDASLRGNSMEYILTAPVPVKDTGKMLDILGSHFKKYGTKLRDSVRTSVHVHVNVQDMCPIHLVNFMVLYIIMEEILVEHCGPSRSGNMFCLRAKDAEYLIDYIARRLKNGKWKELHNDDLRYSSMNVKSVIQRGSLEFRAMRGTSDFNLIENWVGLLYNLKGAAAAYDVPQDIIAGFSEAEGPAFVRRILGSHAGEILDKTTDIGRKVKDGMRYAQDIAFCRDWNKLRRQMYEADYSTNPFMAAKQKLGDSPLFSPG